MNITHKEAIRSNTEIYRDVLEGRICARPVNQQKGINLVHAMQEELIENYNIQVRELEQEHFKTYSKVQGK